VDPPRIRKLSLCSTERFITPPAPVVFSCESRKNRRRHAKHITQYDRLIHERVSPESPILPTPCRRNRSGTRNAYSAKAPKTPHEHEILHNRQVRESSDAEKSFRADEDRLVAVW